MLEAGARGSGSGKDDQAGISLGFRQPRRSLLATSTMIKLATSIAFVGLCRQWAKTIKPNVAGAKSPGVVSIRLWWRSPCKDLIKPGLFAPCPPRLTLGFGLHDQAGLELASATFRLCCSSATSTTLKARLDQACHDQSRPRQSPSIAPWLRSTFAVCVGSGQGLSRPRSVWPPSSSPVAKSPGCVGSAWRRSLLATSTTRKPDSPCSVCSKPVCGVPAGQTASIR